MVKPTLLVLAAGMGSRYGSLKQMDGVGPNNEAIIDYSIYDAIRAGFGKVVFVIRHSFAKEFTEVFNPERFGGKIEVEFVYQELDYLPEGFSVPEGREKPWGTNHALMMAAEAIHEPFAVINADDFYGADAYKVIGEYLSALGGEKNHDCIGQRYRFARRMFGGRKPIPDLDRGAYQDRTQCRGDHRVPRFGRGRGFGREYSRIDESVRIHA